MDNSFNNPSRDNTIPALTQIARHERFLLEKIAYAEHEADDILVAARTKAADMESQGDSELSEELRKVSEDGDKHCAMLHQAIVAIAENKIRADVDRARGKLSRAAEEVLALVMPCKGTHHD